MQRWYEDTQPWHNETPIKQTDKTEMKALCLLWWIFKAIFKLFRVKNWVAANSLFWREENKPGYLEGKNPLSLQAPWLIFFFLLIPCFATQSDSVPQSWAYSFECGKKLFKENKN